MAALGSEDWCDGPWSHNRINLGSISRYEHSAYRSMCDPSLSRMSSHHIPCSHLRVHLRPQLNRVAKVRHPGLGPRITVTTLRRLVILRRLVVGRRSHASTDYTHSSILVTSLAMLSLHQRLQCTAQIRVRLVTLDRLASRRQDDDRVRRIAGLFAPAGAIRVSRRRHRVSSHNGLRAPLSEPPKLAAPRCRCRCRCRCNKFAPGPLAPRAGPGPRLRPRAACPMAWRPPSTHLPARGRSGATRPPSDPTAILLTTNLKLSFTILNRKNKTNLRISHDIPLWRRAARAAQPQALHCRRHLRLRRPSHVLVVVPRPVSLWDQNFDPAMWIPAGRRVVQVHCRSDARPALPSLDPIALRRSLAAPGADARWRATFAKLDAGRPLTLAVFGASVAQNAGCTAQPDKRCFKYGPHANVHGFAVQLLEHLNRSWPHEGHDSERRPRCDAAERRNPLFVHARPARIARCGHRRVGLDGSVHEGRPSLLDDREPRAAAPLPWPRTRDHLALDQRLVQGRRS